MCIHWSLPPTLLLIYDKSHGLMPSQPLPLFLPLSLQSGVPGGIFIHASGFIGGHATKEGAIEMTIKVMFVWMCCVTIMPKLVLLILCLISLQYIGIRPYLESK